MVVRDYLALTRYESCKVLEELTKSGEEKGVKGESTQMKSASVACWPLFSDLLLRETVLSQIHFVLVYGARGELFVRIGQGCSVTSFLVQTPSSSLIEFVVVASNEHGVNAGTRFFPV